ncbi:MAG: hypothetical protein MUD12_16180 [Spirochaetes bacterium]|jgi:hypothetical protein|nr:hypothetical protein [Spirochaetota bacterium]
MTDRDTGAALKASSPRKAWNLFYSAGSLIFNLFSPSVDEKLTRSRREICEGCALTDPEDRRLYRKIKGEAYACGVPFFKKMLRDPKREGCGCYLNLKWKKRFTGCPNGLW